MVSYFLNNNLNFDLIKSIYVELIQLLVLCDLVKIFLPLGAP